MLGDYINRPRFAKSGYRDWLLLFVQHVTIIAFYHRRWVKPDLNNVKSSLNHALGIDYGRFL